jgi:hypothetical protein
MASAQFPAMTTRFNLFIYLLLPLWFFPNLQSAAAQHGVVALPGHINNGQANFAPVRYADKLYFSTYAPQPGKHEASVGGIMSARIAGGSQRPLLDKNSSAGATAANLALMPDASRMYFSRCEEGGVFDQKKCSLWYSDKQFEGDWGTPKKLPKHINFQGFTATQPSIAFDKTLRKYVLYFVSDRPGGQGGMDIWASALEPDGSFGYPVNLPFNTAKDDLTPYFDAPAQRLFFSSNGLFGLGGFDIYQIEKNNTGGWQQPENLGDLVNSWDDELYFTYHPQSQRGYFASNREAGGLARAKSLFNIFEMQALLEIVLLALDEETSIPVFGAWAEVWKIGSERPLVFREQPFDEGLSLSLEGGKQYHIILRAEGYAPIALELDAVGMAVPMSMRRKVFLKKEGEASVDFVKGQQQLAQPARFLNTSPQAVFDKSKNSLEDLLGLPF